jgi:hypothetical protein
MVMANIRILGDKLVVKNRLVFRYAERKDVPLILWFIKELADYEKRLDEVVATEELLEEWIFDKNKAEVLFAMEDEKTVCAQIVGWVNASSDNIDDERRLFDGFFKKYE